MKKIDFPLWADTLLTFGGTFLLFFCILRFYLSSPQAALALSLAGGGAAAFLLHLIVRRRHKKRHTAAQSRAEIQKLSFHLAVDARANSLRRFAEAIAADSGKDAVIAGGRILSDGTEYFLLFRLEGTTADEIASVLRRGGGEKAVLASSFTKEARALALSFGIRLLDASDCYALLERADKLPERYLGESAAAGWKEALRLRLCRKSWKGYLLVGAGLLLFSLISLYPVYYIAAGGLLLAAAALVRIFGRT